MSNVRIIKQHTGYWSVVHNNHLVVVEESYAIASAIADALMFPPRAAETEAEEVAESIRAFWG